MKKIKPLYLQIAFTLLAFIMMVVFSFIFNSRTVEENLSRNAEIVLSFTHQQIESELIASKMMLGSFSETVRAMLADGQDADKIQDYIDTISKYINSEESGLTNINGIYGYFRISGEDVFLHCSDNSLDSLHETKPFEFICFQNQSAITETAPYKIPATGEYVITYARCMHDDTGVHLAIVCIDVPLDKIGEIVIGAALNDGGYGALIAPSPDLTILAHANPELVGVAVGHPSMPISKYEDKFLRGEELYENQMKNWLNEDVVAFSRVLPNGWHILLMTPRDLYYQGTNQMLVVLCFLGGLLSVVLAMVLIRIDKARVRADEESRYKSAFLANMSHEIRTPMNAIIGMTALGKNASDTTRKDYCFEKIDNASHHLLGVINDILDMSKIEANKFELSNEEFDFEKMLQRVINIIGFRADELNQKLTVHIDKSIPRVLIGDDQRLTQVITNLLGNAVKFTPEKGSIRLDTRFVSEKDGEYTIRITVKDSGIGITEEQQQKLFEAFRQADSKTSRKFGGTGLGLAISKSIVELMGGSIELESEIGKGSSFSFTFKARRSPTKSRALSESGVNWDNVSIMVVDDDPKVLEYFEELLQSFGASCDTALSGKAALEQIKKKGHYNIYFIDWKMPDIDGIALAKEIKSKEDSSEGGDNSIIIMISAAEWSQIADEAKKAGVGRFLSKPLFPSAVADSITEAIGSNREDKDEKVDIEGIFKGSRILLAEDVDINREIINVLLEPTLIDIDFAENGKQAVEMFEIAPEEYDLIFMDIQMPEMDGYEATRKIRESGLTNALTIPIIAMTANVFREDINNCLEAGMNEHVGKPLDINEVFRVMKKYLLK
jgi:signal transduction histidine kinase/DNA-binding response OmpR family regulator